MRTSDTEHTKYSDGDSLLKEISNCDIFHIDESEDFDDEFTLSCFGCHDDMLIVTREELRQIGEAIIALSKA
jgi:hypothetical protein